MTELEDALQPTQRSHLALNLLRLLDSIYRQEDLAWAHDEPNEPIHIPRPKTAGIDYLFVRAILRTLFCVLIT